MSEEKKYEMERGKFNLLKTDPKALEENPSRPIYWGKLVIPDGAKAGDTLKLACWKGTSQAGNPYLNGKCELEVKPAPAEVTNDDTDF